MYYYGNRRELHSFPTRRSSDLLRADLVLERERADHLCRVVVRATDEVQHRRTARSPGLGRLGQNRRDGHVEFAEDRKSTRLNSSHSQISYAVFCLKKKTKEDIT